METNNNNWASGKKSYHAIKFMYFTGLMATHQSDRSDVHLCNNFKGIQTDAVDPLTSKKVTLFNPRKQQWSKHFKWSEDGAQIIGITACGRATDIVNSRKPTP